MPDEKPQPDPRRIVGIDSPSYVVDELNAFPMAGGDVVRVAFLNVSGVPGEFVFRGCVALPATLIHGMMDLFQHMIDTGQINPRRGKSSGEIEETAKPNGARHGTH
jgi:hypothetical protein